ncbi:uncharacterized protein [Dermacentor andersoni]|uniref:uncharacterized protein isoform X2 n=1 Tax=Dermacentor andersoni TaxID=34620 RepID=UPI003B3A5167
MSSRGDEGLNGSLKKSGSKCSKELLRSEIITREDHIRSLVQSKGPPKTFQVRSSALAQARSFLPKLVEAERTRLAAGCDDGASIEAEDTTSEGPFIEMLFLAPSFCVVVLLRSLAWERALEPDYTSTSYWRRVR